jgi:tetratricopeptide (TPR) repeat protein
MLLACLEQGTNPHAAMIARLGDVREAFLLIIDNAEDSLQPDALPFLLAEVMLGCFTGTVGITFASNDASLCWTSHNHKPTIPTHLQIMANLPDARLVVTSRVELPQLAPVPGRVRGVRNIPLAQLLDSDAEKLVRLVPSSQALSDDQIAAVVAACSGVPLLLKVLTDALACGCISLADVRRVEGGGSSTEAVGRTIALTIRALPDERLRDALVQLAVFPSGWEDGGAAAVMDCDEGRATALVRQLHVHGLALFDSSTGRHYLHMAVREATATEDKSEAGLAAKQRFMAYVLGLMSQWAQLFESRSYGLALRKLRSHDADTSALFKALAGPGLSPATAAAAADAMNNPIRPLLNAAGLLTSKQSLEAWRNVAAVLSTDERRQAAARLCCSWHLKARGDYPAALEDGRAAMQAYERTLGPEDPSMLTSISNLGICLGDMGQHGEALRMHQRAVEDCERMLGADQPSTLNSMNNLAYCLRALKKPGAALPLHQRALEAYESRLDREHPDTLAAVNYLAGCFVDLARQDKALPLYQRALEARERTLGPEHPSTLVTVSWLADCLGAQHGKALPLYERVLEARDRILGREHPETLVTVSRLAHCAD